MFSHTHFVTQCSSKSKDEPKSVQSVPCPNKKKHNIILMKAHRVCQAYANYLYILTKCLKMLNR